MSEPVGTARGRRVPQLVCPAGSLRALQLAVDAGADAVYLSSRDATNARNVAGLNTDGDQLREGVRYAQERNRHVLMAVNTYADARDPSPWYCAVDRAAELGVDAVIAADTAVMAYARRRHPELCLHLSVQASATTGAAIEFYRSRYGIRRAVLPRVLTWVQVRRIMACTEAEIEVFGFGSLCVMAEGRCALSSYTTGQSPNTSGVCSPPAHVRWNETPEGVEARLGGVLIDRFVPDEPVGYPTPCKGRFVVEGARDYAIESPTSLNTLALLPQMIESGIAAIRIEGRQRSPAYVAEVTGFWRQAIDLATSTRRFSVSPAWSANLARWAEGQQITLGAFERHWR